MIDINDENIQLIEDEIMLMYDKKPCDYPDYECLLSLRKYMINRNVLKHQEEILPDIIAFNDALREALKEMYDRAHHIWNSIKGKKDFGDEMELTAKCFLSCDYPELHLVQKDDRQDLWYALCDSGWNRLYDLGVAPELVFPRDIDDSFDHMIGMDCPPPNWNEGLDWELTKELHLIYPFHNLFEHLSFAITDFIYVRKFETEINIEIKKVHKMTYKELLDSVSFDEIVPYISKYHGDNDCLVLYKIHYDMLQSLTPDPKKADYKTATVDYYESEDDETESYLHVHPIEGQIWEGALSMELTISPNVKESLAEIAACCLWHTSFYGFTDEDLQEYFNRLENGYEKIDKEDFQMYIRQIEQAGGHVPLMSELSDIRIKAKYRKRIELVSKFISGVLPQETDVVGLPIDSLCELYRAKHCKWYMLQSYSRDSAQRMCYIKELIEKYNAFCCGVLENVIVVITTSEEYPLLMAEMELLEYIAKMCDGEFSFMVKMNAGLQEEMKVDFLFYEYEKE